MQRLLGTLLWVPLTTAFLASCEGLGSLPRGLAHALTTSSSAWPARVYLQDDEILAWAAPLSPHEMPRLVERAAESVQPGGETTYGARLWQAGSEPLYLIEKRYPGDPPQHRSVTVDAEGRVVARSHSIPLAEAPLAVREQVAGFAATCSRFEFSPALQGDGAYRARFASPGLPTVEVLFGSDGTVIRRVALLPAEIRVGRRGATPR